MTTMGRINLSPAVPELDGSQLIELIQVWLDEMRTRLPQLTVNGYAFKIAYFEGWWREVGPGQGWRLRRRDLVKFAGWLCTVRSEKTGRLLSYNSRRDVLRRLRQMFVWAYANGYTDMAYASWVPAAEGEAPVRQAASLEVLGALMRAAGQGAQPLRDQAILAVLIGTGMRRGECASLRIEHLVFHSDGSGVATVWGKKTRSNPSGRRQVAFDSATGRYVLCYMEAAELGQRGWLFPGARMGTGLTDQTVYRVVKGAIRAAGLENVLQGCHDLRRTFATLLARQARRGDGLEADMLRRQMGHASYSMTTRYTLLDAEDVRLDLRSPLSLMEELGED